MRALITYSALALGAITLGTWIAQKDLSTAPPDFGMKSASPLSNSPRSNTTETYLLKRHLHAILQSNGKAQPFADIDYDGTFSVSWVNAFTARVSFEIKEGPTSSLPFEVTLNHWAVSQIRVGEPKTETELEASQILKDFVALWAYRSDEDTTGKYQAKWTPEGLWLLKNKIHYEGISASEIQVQKSEHRIYFAPASKELIQAEGIEQTSMRTGTVDELVTTSTYSLHRKNELVLVRGTPPSSLPLTVSSFALGPNHFSPGPSWLMLRSDLHAFKKLSPSSRLQLFHQVSKALLGEPEIGLKNFLEWATPRLNDAEFRAFSIGVLATAGGPEMQKTLLQWFQQFPSSQFMILNSLTTTTAPLSPETKTFLSSLLNQEGDQAYAAAFALGSGIKNAPAQSANEIQRLESIFRNTDDPNEKAIFLDAMGNSGNSHFIPEIQRSLTSQNEEIVREKAVLALRFMPGTETVALLKQARNDPSAKVRAATRQVMQQRSAKESTHF